MKTTNFKVAMTIVAVFTAFNFASQLHAQRPGGGTGQPGFGPAAPFINLLDESQKTAVRDLMNRMREDGATRSEIYTAVVELLSGWGIEVPTGNARVALGANLRALMQQLTQEQRAAVRELISTMRTDGASGQEIRAAVAALLSDWGIEVRAGNARVTLEANLRALLQQLTQEQQVAVRELISTMRADSAASEEIHAAVLALLNEWGIELPDGDPATAQDTEPIRARNYPNPFNPETHIAYTLNSPGQVNVFIYNVTGQLVRSFEIGYQSAGTYSVSWDGTTASGTPAPSGIYFYRIQAGPDVLTQRMLLTK